MSSFVVLRPYKRRDQPFCKILLKNSIMENMNRTFFRLLFTDITLIAIIIFILTMFLLSGVPTYFYVIGVLTELIVVYIITYINFWIDAEKAQKEVSQISRIYMSDNSSHFWVAELYEDYSLNRQERDQRYKFMTKEKFNQSNINVSKYVKKIVGTIGLCKNNKLQNSGWIKRLCVHKNYRRKGIGINLVNVALEYGSQQKYRCINVIISVHRKAARELFITKNFEIYSHHKKLHRTSVTLSFIELTYQLRYISNDEFFATDTIYAQTL